MTTPVATARSTRASDAVVSSLALASHSAEHHLQVSAEAYDAAIRRFVPHYEEALSEVAAALSGLEGEVLDVGAGTGALTGYLARALPRARFTALDVDGAMLGQARARLRELGGRVKYVQAPFLEARGPVDAVVASLSLHHVPTREEKVRVYAHLRSVGRVLISSDAMVSREPRAGAWAVAEVLAHLVRNGDTPEAAQARFDSWQREDFYFGIAEELEMLREAGFSSVDVRWRRGPLGVIVAQR
ncbi:MAG: class I SAM-dependent methyltransferase [Myxococcota bacterium]